MKFGDPNQTKYLANSSYQQLMMGPIKNKDTFNDKKCANVWIYGLHSENQNRTASTSASDTNVNSVCIEVE